MMRLADHAVTLEALHSGHAPAVLAFERENREFFAGWVGDRGDDYFAEFDDRHAALLAEQRTGICRFHVLVDDAGAVAGRVNLFDLEQGTARLGYRIAESAGGRGLATAAVRAVMQIARTEYGLTMLRATVLRDNAASRAVLQRTGFSPIGDTDVAMDIGVGREYVTALR